ncbi:MAG: P-II family nitrogen regulator [Thermoproteota archaeon]|mgnify:FL=1|jgi:nitrogen regulatory protein P-II 1
MLKIEGIIRSSKLYAVQEALAKLGIPTFSSYEVKLSGIHRGHSGWRNRTSDFIPKSKIEILCNDGEHEKIVDTILETAKTGDKGDGIVFVYQVDKLVKIKTGETGESALR